MATGSVGNAIRKVGASVFFIGYLPGSGTAASAVTALALWFANEKIAPLHGFGGAVWYWLAALAVTAVSFFFSSRSTELFGKEDSSRIVIDEVAGQMITFILVPLSIRTLITGFVLFRFFDIVKPFPIYHMEELADGVGVTMDDVAAGVLANISLMIILFAYHVVKGYLS